MQPERLGAWLVAEAAARSGLQITTRTPASLRLRDGLQLGMQGLDVRMPGAETAIVQAEELALRLEWSVLWGEARVRGLDLWQPLLDQSALDDWMASINSATGPANTTAGFALTELRALRVRGGSWQLDGSRIGHVDLDLEGFAQGETSALDASLELAGDSSTLRLNLQFEGAHTDLYQGIAWPELRAMIEVDGVPTLQIDGGARLLPVEAIALEAKLQVLGWPESALGAQPDWIAPLLQSGLRLTWPVPDLDHPRLRLLGEGSGHRIEALLAPTEIQAWWAQQVWWQAPPLSLQARIDRLDIDGIELHGVSIDASAETGDADESSARGGPDAP